ncbi:hypothetical protein F5050DRAFT_1780757 [Lentinula boryana]|uniref:Uncharacterized protein n=1 Tax=Lentinula boryana TaxID=40481 RepID=A0ABQ8Q4A6_9AGAR|nr:hypothetical protein F5050DRAFT_1780757 [Lentinula boryana]
MQLRLSFVLLGIATAALSRPIVVSQTIPTALSSTTTTSAPASTLTSTLNSLSTPPPTLLSTPDFDARQISDPYLEDRSLDLDALYIREIPSNSASSLDSRVVKDPSSEIAQSYANTHTSMDTRAEIHGNVASDGYLSKRDVFEWFGKKAGQVTHNPAIEQIGGGFKTLGGEIRNEAKGMSQHAKAGFNEGAGAGAPPQSRQLSDPVVETRDLVEQAQHIEDKENQMKNGASNLKSMITNPFHKAHDQMTAGLQNVENSAKQHATAAANSVKNAGAGAWRGAEGAVSGAKQGYQEGANGGDPAT